jgi:hypothetical protein
MQLRATAERECKEKLLNNKKKKRKLGIVLKSPNCGLIKVGVSFKPLLVEWALLQKNSYD